MSHSRLLERSRTPAFADAGWRFLTTLRRRIRHHRTVRETSIALSQMNDRQLADIGLSRSMIMSPSATFRREIV
jgi:uncharacterized protein YjiS (DUF1127 family)